MARYETYQANAAQAPIMRKWIFRALLVSLLLHAGLFVFFRAKRLQNFGLGEVERLVPRMFNVKQVTIDPKTLENEEVKTTLPEKPKPLPKIEVPVEKVEPSEISLKPSNAEVSSPLLVEKPDLTALNKDLLAKAESLSAGAMEKENGSIANSLLKDSVRNPRQPVVFTLPQGSKEMGGGVGDHEGIPGLRSLDDAIAATGPLATGDRLGVRGGALFEYDKADLLPQSIEDLRKLGEIIKRNPRATFVIEGHTDSLGNSDYNIDLSQRRADSVRAWLLQNMGIPEDRVQTIGYGSTRPVVVNGKPVTGNVEEQAPNRRVEIVIKTNKGK